MFKNRVKVSYLRDLREVVKVNLAWERTAGTDEQTRVRPRLSDYNLSGKHNMYAADDIMWYNHVVPRVKENGRVREVLRREELRRNPVAAEIAELRERVEALEATTTN